MAPTGQRAKNRGTSTDELLAQNLQQLTQLTQALANTLLNNNRNGPDIAKIVAERHPPYFDGQEDPLVLEDWIRAFDKMFEAINCPEERRVEIAAFYLRQEADNWWGMVGPSYRQENGFGWETFKDRVRCRFYPEHVRAAKYEEFLHLRQGNSTVQEYYARFLELARFAPALVPDEPSKTRKFVSGLTFETQKVVCVFECQTLGEAYSRAANHFRVNQLQKNVLERNKRKAAESDRFVNKKPRIESVERVRDYPRSYSSDLRRNYHPQNQMTTGGSWTRERHYYCQKCGKDHPGVDCQGNIVTCLNCGKRGHRAFECRAGKNVTSSSLRQHGSMGQPSVNQSKLRVNGVRDSNNNGGNIARLNNQDETQQSKIYVMSRT